jgi:hypothetical protein
MPTTASQYSILKNTSGATRFFGYLPNHGKTLTANQDYTFFGDIWGRMGQGDGRINERKRASFEADLLAGNIEIINSSMPVYYDAAGTAVKIVKISSGVLSADNPSWGTYSGSS